MESLKNNEAGGNDGLVGELFKYGGKGMACLFKAFLCSSLGSRGHAKKWRQGLIVSLHKEGDAEDPGILEALHY